MSKTEASSIRAWAAKSASAKLDILRLFIGSYTSIPRIAIMTPIGLIRDIFLESSLTIAQSSGWWQSAHCRVGKIEFLLVHVPQGTAIIDAVLAVGSFAPKLVFVGYCGGLAENLRIGRTVSSLGVYHDDVFERCLWPLCLGEEQGVTGHAQSLLLEDEPLLQAMRARSVLALDMETFYVYRYSRQIGALATALQIVSDLPEHRQFFRLEPGDLAKVEDGVREAVKRVVAALTSM